MPTRPRAPKGPRNKAAVGGATNPALEALPTPEPTDAQRRALEAIGKLGKGANRVAIARELEIDRSGVREKLAALERKGLIKPVYKRVVARFTLTETGQAVLEEDDRS